jgi:hypothetical protein
MAILVPFILLLNHPLELLYPVGGNGIAHVANSLDHIFSQYIAHFWVAFLFFLIVIFTIFAIGSWPGYIDEF